MIGYIMTTKYKTFKLGLAASVIPTVLVLTPLTIPVSSAAQDDGSSQIVQYNSKKDFNKNTRKRSRTFTYNDVQSKPDPLVATATEPVKFSTTLDVSTSKISANIPYDLGYQGEDVYVAVIDTGVESAHPFLQNRVALEACFSDQCPDGTEEQYGPGSARPVHWHGTHVAGIVAGYNSTFRGVAPKVKIIAINVFDPYGGAYDESIIKALEYVYSIADTYNIASVNMSLGSSRIFKATCDDYIPAMTTAIKNLKSKNIATVVASGNSYAVGMSAPACISDSVSVAATSSWTDKVTEFSNVSQYTTLSAPGLTIKSSKLMGAYATASGTSMAAPHAAGAYAVYRSKFGVQSVSKVTSDFQSASVPALDEYSSIITKRIDFKKIFDPNYVAPPVTTTIPQTTTTTTPPVVTTSTTVVASPTTTVPSQSTTTTSLPVTSTTSPVVTTTTVPSPTTTVVTTYINPPSINRIVQINSSTFGITLRYYTYNNAKPSSINVYCYAYDDSTDITYQVSFPYTSGNLLNYQFISDSTMVKYCRANAVSSNNVMSRYTQYIGVTK
jgi:subtilisin family serine protease